MKEQKQWVPITVSGPPRVGSPEGDRVRLIFVLSEEPPREWATHFDEAFADRLNRRRGERLPVPAPSVHPEGVHVLSNISEDEAASWIEGVEQQVAEANEWFAENVIGEGERREVAQRKAEEADERTREEMRRLVEGAWKRTRD